jgi:hypothetical protein
VNFVVTEFTGPDGAFGFFPVASKLLSSPKVKFKLGVSISGSTGPFVLVGYGVVGARPEAEVLMNGIGDAAKETPDFGVCTNVSDVGVSPGAVVSLPKALPIGDETCALCTRFVANKDTFDVVAPIGVALRAPASLSKVCKIRLAVSVVTALVTVLPVGVSYD